MSFHMGGALGGKRKVAWVNWEIVCRSKELGGLGVKNLGLFNVALLLKWAWRILDRCDGLWSQVLASKYGDFYKAVGCVRRG